MMATADTRARADFTYIWTIENVSKLTQLNLKSPSFVAHSVSKVEWYLEIEEIMFICCCSRSEDARREDPLAIETEFSLLAADGSPLISKRSDNHTFFIFLMKKEEFTERWAEIISNNTLTVRYRMWRKGPKLKTTDICYARTTLKTLTKSLVWPIKEFSALNSTAAEDINTLSKDEQKIYPLNNFVQERHFIGLILYLKRNPESEDVCVDFLIENGTDCGYKCELTIVDVNGEVIVSKLEGIRTYFKRKCLKFRNMISKSKLISNKNLFLPNDTLLLRCSFEVCTGATSCEIEYCTPNASSVVKDKALDTKVKVFKVKVGAMDDDDLLQFGKYFINDTDESILADNLVVEKSNLDFCNKSCPLKSALRCLQNETTLSDISLRIGAKLYPVHKNILSSRSSVFKTIFSKDIKENTFDIHDMDEFTLCQLLQYVYTDKVEDLEFENALCLLKAASDYQLFSLKDKCSDILSLANKYRDEKLEIEDFDSGLNENIQIKEFSKQTPECNLF